jgi:hypothetical protein
MIEFASSKQPTGVTGEIYKIGSTCIFALNCWNLVILNSNYCASSIFDVNMTIYYKMINNC